MHRNRRHHSLAVKVPEVPNGGEGMVPTQIKQIAPFEWTRILQDSRAEGLDLVNRLLKDFQFGANRFDAPGEALFACLSGYSVVAVAGLNREPDGSFEGAGRIRRLYVLPELRGQGLGRNLVTAVTALAQSHFNVLTVNVGRLDASGFYEHLGFTHIDHPNITHIKELVPNKGVHLLP